ncbi:MAG: hypothetical protein BGO49_19550 [Planctomycetales bacterium 71-10]|nr:MAG: hypothetical protein BGO49_19550 [Planctomycetales bacterium 71-10]
MDRAAGGPQGPPLIPDFDPSARVVYVPVRHHSPACARQVERLVRDVRPDAVLIEGPRDATPLIPLLTHPKTRTPVAIYTTFVRRADGDVLRHGAYYPLCDYSPELAAIRAAAEVGARARFIDLTYPEMILAGRDDGDARAQSLQDERRFSHSALLWETCRRVGARDPDDLWDHLYEVDGDLREPSRFFRDVLAYCALARRDCGPDALAADGTLAREAAMAAAVAEEAGRVVVVTGGFHTVALAETLPAMPAAVSADPADALVVLVRYGFEQLDRLNGYASGMPAPGFYQRSWDGQDPAAMVVETARECRKRRIGTSVADEIAALEHARRLAAMRGHARPSREDMLDGIRSVFIKGSDDVEGVAVLAIARKLMAGDRIGDVPPEAGVAPIVRDFRDTAARLKMDLGRIDAREVALDIYRKARARETSRFFHRLRFLDVPFAEFVAGPDYVTGEHLERVQEVWKHRWSPQVESSLIDRAPYGSTLDEAAANVLLERFAEAESQGQGRRSDLAARLVVEACRMGLHRHSQSLIERTGRLVAEDASFPSLVGAAEQLLVLHVSREPLEAHHLSGPEDLASVGYDRACYLIPTLAGTAESEEMGVLDSLLSLQQVALTLGDRADRRELRWARLRDLAEVPDASAALRGGALGLLFADGRIDPSDLAERFRGHLVSTRPQGEGAAFLRGLLRTARSALWAVPELLAALHEQLGAWDEDAFIRILPDLRLAFADLTPRECDRVAEAAAGLAGAAATSLVALDGFEESDLLRGLEIERHVREVMARDALEDYGG